MIIIGVDPHPGSHTAAALDENGTTLGALRVDNNPAELDRLWQWAQAFPARRWAIEGAGNPFIAAWVAWLLAEGEKLVHISPNLTSQYRSRRGKKKDDLIDAENIARALWANPALPAYHPPIAQRELQELSRNRQRLAQQLKANRMALAALSPDSPVRAALDLAIDSLQQAIKHLEQELARRLATLAPELLEVRGVGTVLAGVLLAESGNMARFESEAKFAGYCGAAPVRRGSGNNLRVQVNPAGNRRLNYVLHLIARNRLSTDGGRSRALMDKKLQEGKTKKQAYRVLKTYIARELYRFLRAHHPCPTQPHTLAA